MQEPTAAVTDNRSPGTLLAAIVDLSRTRQALLSVAQPALGAVLALGRLPDTRTMLLGLVAATCGYLAVFSLNDVLDRRVDARALAAGKADFEGFDLDTAFVRHPLARGDISYRLALAWVATLALVSGVCAYLLSPICLVLFAAAVTLEVVYCMLRGVTWAKTFVSGAMVGVGGLAGWAAVAPIGARALPFFVFLAVWEIAGRNLPNDLADLPADSRTGIKTVATVLGPRVSANAIIVGTFGIAVSVTLLRMPLSATASCIGVALWLMAAPTWNLVREPASDKAAAYFNRASLLPAIMLPIVILTTGALAR